MLYEVTVSVTRDDVAQLIEEARHCGAHRHPALRALLMALVFDTMDEDAQAKFSALNEAQRIINNRYRN